MSAMLQTKHLGEKIFLFSLTGLILLLSADYKYLFLPINGIWLLLYILIISVATIWATFTCVQKLLQQTIPLDYSGMQTDNYAVSYMQKLCSYMIPSSIKLPEIQQIEKQQMVLKPIDERIEELSNDIEIRFIAKWYDNITKDDTFKTETKQLLEMVIRRFLQVAVQVDSKKIAIGSLSIILKHLREYRKTLRRIERNGGNVEALYRYSHVASKSPKALEHFLHKLTGNLVKEFISWELCNSLPCRLLVAILARKMATYLLISVSEPGCLNYNILTVCAPKKSIELSLNQYAYISLSDVDLSGNLEQLNLYKPHDEKPQEKKVIEIISSSVEPNSYSKQGTTMSGNDGNTPKISPKKKAYKPKDAMGENKDNTTSVADKAGSQKHQQDGDSKMAATAYTSTTKPIDIVGGVSGIKYNSNGDPYKSRHGGESVKIYEPRPTSKTWRDSSDLDCISLGQDLLALQGDTAPTAATDSTASVCSAGVPIVGGPANTGGELPISSFIERKLWGDTESLGSDKSLPKNHHHPMWDINESWLGEDDAAAGNREPPQDANGDLLGGHGGKKGRGLGVSPSGSAHCLASKVSTTSASSIITNTMGNVTASTIHNMKELQKSTVNNVVKPVSQATTNAMHKIEDFQDEAAGVMEGILDFGIAGLRKGLRLTGLQDIHAELQGSGASKQSRGHDKGATGEGGATASALAAKSSKTNVKLVKIGHVTSEDVKNVLGPDKHTVATTGSAQPPTGGGAAAPQADPDDSVWMNPLNKDSPGSFDGHILLETSSTCTVTTSIPLSYSAELNKLKENVNDMINVESTAPITQTTASNAPKTTNSQNVTSTTNIPQISTDFDALDDASLVVDSPEYEEAADLESTIIKLRSLLQQRSSESSLNTPAVSPMPLDDPKMMCTTPVDLVECTKTDSTMPSLYKLCAKTATGVFNTVKNVLPGNAIEQGNAGHEKWLFVENEVQPNDLMVLMEGLLVERRDFCTVDTAYEAMDSADLLTESASSQQSWNNADGIVGPQGGAPGAYDEETDDLEATIPITKSLIDIACECLGHADTVLVREPLVKAVLILGGNKCEGLLERELKRFVRQVNRYVEPLPKGGSTDVTAMKLGEIVDAVVAELPGFVKKIVGEHNLSEALSFLVTSMQSQQINQDIMVQIFELISAQVIVASSLMSPTPSA